MQNEQVNRRFTRDEGKSSRQKFDRTFEYRASRYIVEEKEKEQQSLSWETPTSFSPCDRDATTKAASIPIEKSFHLFSKEENRNDVF